MSVSDKKEAEKVTKDLNSITKRWNEIKVEISSVESMLDEVIANWKRYNACRDLFTVWLADAEKMLKKPAEERGVRGRYV